MNVIAVVRKYIIKDLTGLVENYYIQKKDWNLGQFGCWTKVSRYSSLDIFYGACKGGYMEIIEKFSQKIYLWATEFNAGINFACRDPSNLHLDIAEYMLKKGADRVNIPPESFRKMIEMCQKIKS